jgi:hypothetical protein
VLILRRAGDGFLLIDTLLAATPAPSGRRCRIWILPTIVLGTVPLA